MKRRDLFVLPIVLLMAITACGGNAGSSSEEGFSSSPTTSGSVSSGSESSGESSGGSSASSSSSSSGSSGSSSSDSTSSGGGGGGGGDKDDLPSSIDGADDTEIDLGSYFDLMEGVSGLSEKGDDISDRIAIKGTVNYGVSGTYQVEYSLTLNDHTITQTRNIKVGSSGISKTDSKKAKEPESAQVSLGNGSYLTGDADITRPASPRNLGDNLVGKPVETNSWYSGLFSTSGSEYVTGLYASNYMSKVIKTETGGDSGRGIYSGIEFSKIGDGGVNYNAIDPDTISKQPSVGVNNFTSSFRNIVFRKNGLAANPSVRVLSDSDNGVKVALRNSANGADEMVMTYASSSPYMFIETNGGLDLTAVLAFGGVTGGYSFFDLSGNQLNSAYTGDAIIVKLNQIHVGYRSTYPNYGIGAAFFQDYYFLINAATGTTFTPQHLSHPDSTFMDSLKISSSSNFMSVSNINSLSEASFYHQYGYAMTERARSYYQVNRTTSEVVSTFRNNVRSLADGGALTSLQNLYPHQWKQSSVAVTGKTLVSMRGTLKMAATNEFDTIDSFNGVLPSYTLPDAASFDRSSLVSYLTDLDNRAISDGQFDSDANDAAAMKDKDYMDNPTPYWNSKVIYPMSQGLIIADQIGETSLKASFLNKIKSVLVDWFTYSGEDDARFLYYDSVWGSMYYSDDGFSTASRLSDHHFTHGYIAFCSAVVAMYDSQFLSDYGDIVTMLIKDYMNYDRGDSRFPYLRSFDSYAGHSWADGMGDFGDGNDQESSGEALNSWTAAYLFGLASGNEGMVDASIYGFTNEYNSIKQYWFDYDEDNWCDDLANTGIHALGIVWGGKNVYATWFGPNPEFIYGIHWLPTGEYLSGYGVGSDNSMLKKIYACFQNSVSGAPRTWYTNMWSIQALFDPSAAASAFNATKVMNDDYPNELSGSYWMIQALKTLGTKTDSAYMEIDSRVASSIYKDSLGALHAMVWNPSDETRTLTFHLQNGNTKEITSSARSFTKVSL